MFSNYFSVRVGDLEIHLLLKSSSSNQTWNQSVWLCCCGFIVPSGKPFSLELVSWLSWIIRWHFLSLSLLLGSYTHSTTNFLTFAINLFPKSTGPQLSSQMPGSSSPWLTLPPQVSSAFISWIYHHWRHPAACELVSPWAPGQHSSGPVCNMWSASGPASLLLPPWGSSFRPQSSSHLPCFRQGGFSLPLSSSLLSLSTAACPTLSAAVSCTLWQQIPNWPPTSNLFQPINPSSTSPAATSQTALPIHFTPLLKKTSHCLIACSAACLENSRLSRNKEATYQIMSPPAEPPPELSLGFLSIWGILHMTVLPLWNSSPVPNLALQAVFHSGRASMHPALVPTGHPLLCRIHFATSHFCAILV